MYDYVHLDLLVYNVIDICNVLDVYKSTRNVPLSSLGKNRSSREAICFVDNVFE